ncbi:Glycosyl transferase family 2 [Halapricum desulfuricans]|uniref:Glycosyl transferase family 2 n=1 Tax=Halapricum desulfuricans TaxID=2841257 RepID=A0A897MXC1_9EURY|nr:Glycosyl transferase family 2 [Halapricum desulfuricans]
MDSLISSLECANEEFELIIVDDASDTEVKRVVSRHKLGKYVAGEGKGAMYARQRGVEHADGDIIGFLEDDMTVDPNFLKPIINSFKRGENIVQSRLIEQDKRITDFPKSIYRWNFEHSTNFNAKNKKYISVCQESGLFVSAEILDSYPVLNSDLVGDYGSSIDFSLRVRSSGRDILFNPNSKIYHHKAEFGGTIEMNEKSRARSEEDIQCSNFYKEYYHNLTYIHSKYFKRYLLFSILYHIIKIMARAIKYREAQCVSVCVTGMIIGLNKGIR